MYVLHEQVSERTPPVLVVSVLPLGLELGQVHVRRALSLASLAGKAEVHHFGDPAICKKRAGGVSPLIMIIRGLTPPARQGYPQRIGPRSRRVLLVSRRPV